MVGFTADAPAASVPSAALCSVNPTQIAVRILWAQG